MPAPKKGYRLGGSAAHQRLILRNLATALFEHGKVTTTEAKARMLRPYAEKLITKAKKGDLHARRQVLGELFTSVDWKRLEDSGEFVVNKYPQHRLFTEIAPMFADRPGGYTRITKIGPRKGDNAPMAVIELVTEAYKPVTKSKKAAAPVAVEETVEETVEAPEAEVTEAEVTEAPAGFADLEFGDDVAAPLEDNSAPEGFEIKGNKDSGKFHTPASQWYDQTIAEVWFRTEEAAEAAGFVKAG